jgi:hypothetical protein
MVRAYGLIGPDLAIIMLLSSIANDSQLNCVNNA